VYQSRRDQDPQPADARAYIISCVVTNSYTWSGLIYSCHCIHHSIYVYLFTHIYTSIHTHVSTRVLWLIHICEAKWVTSHDVTSHTWVASDVCSHTCDFSLSFTCDMRVSHAYARHDSFIFVKWLIHICATWLIHMRDTTRSYTFSDPFIHVRHDSFICATWLVHICAVPHLFELVLQIRKRAI